MSLKEKSRPNPVGFRISDEMMNDVKELNIDVSRTSREAIQREIERLKAEKELIQRSNYGLKNNSRSR